MTAPSPEPRCNLGRLVELMEAEGLDGLVSYYATNVFYLSGFLSAAGHGRPEVSGEAAVVLSRRCPREPILVVQDSQLGAMVERGGWIDQMRPFEGIVRQLDVPDEHWSIERFLPAAAVRDGRLEPLERAYAPDLDAAVLWAVDDLGLRSGRLACDHPWLAGRLSARGLQVEDGFALLRAVRAVKTAAELDLLDGAARTNEAALAATIDAWAPGATYGDLGRAYQHAVVDLGGRCGDPHPFVLANPADGSRAFLTLGDQLEHEVQPGQNLMFDCHGHWREYCWDGGKTWIVGDEPDARDRRVARACESAMAEMIDQLRPGRSREQLQRIGRRALRQGGVADADTVLLFFHGLGLDHGDIEIPARSTGRDWRLESAMVVSIHLFHPGDATSRYWLEDVAVVGPDGGRSLYRWGLGPHHPETPAAEA